MISATLRPISAGPVREHTVSRADSNHNEAENDATVWQPRVASAPLFAPGKELAVHPPSLARTASNHEDRRQVQWCIVHRLNVTDNPPIYALGPQRVRTVPGFALVNGGAVSQYSLPQLLKSLHDSVQQELARARETFHHNGTMGDASEGVWIKLFNEYLPQRYRAARAHVVDSKGSVSDQIDIVIFDRQYSPFIFKLDEHSFVPAESVYAVFEAKQEADASVIKYAHEKITSVRTLHRRLLPIPGERRSRPPIRILGGLLSLESRWKPPLGAALNNALRGNLASGLVDIGCIASHGHFSFNPKTKKYDYVTTSKAATAFLFKLISKLQLLGTVPMIDLEAYAQWLSKPTRSSLTKRRRS